MSPSFLRVFKSLTTTDSERPGATGLSRLASAEGGPQVDLDEARKCAEAGTVSLNGADLTKVLASEFHEGVFTPQASARDGRRTWHVPLLGEDTSFHAFLSHYQTDSGDFCRSLQLQLKPLGVQVWLSKQLAGQITLEAMTRGVEQSDFYVLVLTETALSRLYVQLELLHALRLGKPFIFLNDEERNPFQFGAALHERVELFPDEWDAKLSVVECMDLLFKETESIRIHRRSPYEAVMVEGLKGNFADSDFYKERLAVTHKLRLLCWPVEEACAAVGAPTRSSSRCCRTRTRSGPSNC